MVATLPKGAGLLRMMEASANELGNIVEMSLSGQLDYVFNFSKEGFLTFDAP